QSRLLADAFGTAVAGSIHALGAAPEPNLLATAHRRASGLKDTNRYAPDIRQPREFGSALVSAAQGHSRVIGGAELHAVRAARRLDAGRQRLVAVATHAGDSTCRGQCSAGQRHRPGAVATAVSVRRRLADGKGAGA